MAQFARAEAAQDGERAVFAYQAIVQEEAAHGRVKKVGERVAVQVYDEDLAARDAAQLVQDMDDLLVFEMMREERADGVIETTFIAIRSPIISSRPVAASSSIIA